MKENKINVEPATVQAAIIKPTAVPQNFVGSLADEIAKTLAKRFPGRWQGNPQKKKKLSKKDPKKRKEAERAIFLDTSAIIDGRVFDVIDTGILNGFVIVPEFILLELKHIADSQDMVKRERGQRGLERLEKVKKSKYVKLLIIPGDAKVEKNKEVDEKLLAMTKQYRGRLITCDFNLEKKSAISGVTSVNIHNLANKLKIIAVPGESLHIKIQHIGKDPTQGVGYLDDGTMVVVEQGSLHLDHFVNIVVSRVIQTSSGRMLFAKKI